MPADELTQEVDGLKVDTKRVSKEGMSYSKEKSLSNWYNELILKAKLISYYQVTGFYIILPNAYAIWEQIQQYVDKHLKMRDMRNCYFPLVVTEENMKKESSHLEDFAPELAYLNITEPTEGSSSNRIALRATSEAVMYPTVKKMINSYRDLPLKLNQWCNICRLESKQCWPFIRTREFLWHEGHTAHSSESEAIEFAKDIGDLYVNVLRDRMALPCIVGKKTDAEKFAGSSHSITCEVFIPENGRSIQATTSHYLGTNFAKMFDIKYLNPDNHEEFLYVFQTCFAITTRSIGILIMVHGDDKGLVLPPRIAPYQCVVVPCGIKAKSTQQEIDSVLSACDSLSVKLDNNGLRSKIDTRLNVTPGVKFNQYELEGIPLRIEIGPNDIKKDQITVCSRFDNEKFSIMRENCVEKLHDILEEIQLKMLEKARLKSEQAVSKVGNWTEFCAAFNKDKVLFAPFCGKNECEAAIRRESRSSTSEGGNSMMGAKSLVIPFDNDAVTVGTKCVYDQCVDDAKYMCYFGRSY